MNGLYAYSVNAWTELETLACPSCIGQIVFLIYPDGDILPRRTGLYDDAVYAQR